MFRGKSHFSVIKVIVFTLGLSISAYGQTTHNVTLSGMSFTPPDLTIQVGDTVHWEWLDGVHNVESGTIVSGAGVHDNIFRSGDPASALTYDLTFDQAFLDANPVGGDLYTYYCIVHAFGGMAGTITVEATVEVPTVSQWGMIVMVLVIISAGTLLIFQKSRRSNRPRPVQ